MRGKRDKREQLLAAGNRRCPICGRAFLGSVIPTLEHVPPKSVGGTIVCLTCKTCNSAAGRRLDRAAAQHSTGLTTGYINLEGYGEKKFRMQIRYEAGKVGVSLLDGDPGRDFREWRKILASRRQATERLTLTYAQYTTKEISWLRSAYLALFGLVGNELLEQTTLDSVREQLLSPTETQIRHHCIPLPSDQKNHRGIWIARKPIRCWVITLDGIGVILPHDMDNDLYERVSAIEGCPLSLEGVSDGFITYHGYELSSLQMVSAKDTTALFGETISITDDSGRQTDGVIVSCRNGLLRFVAFKARNDKAPV